MLCLFYFRSIVHRIPSLKMVYFFSFSFLIFYCLCFSSMYYTDVCNVLAINVQRYLKPNTCYVMLCYCLSIVWFVYCF